MNFISKLNTLFRVEKVKEVEGAHVWVVSWDARTGDYSNNIKRVAKSFLIEEDANQFAKSLEQAQNLLQNTNRLRVKVEKQL